MPERINAAHRLDQVLSRAAKLDGTRDTLDAWDDALRIKEKDPQITDQRTLAVEVARMVGLL